MPTLSDIKLCEPMNEGLWGGGGSWGGSGSRAAESGQVHRLVRSPPFLNARSQRSRTKERLQIRGHKGASVLGASLELMSADTHSYAVSPSSSPPHPTTHPDSAAPQQTTTTQSDALEAKSCSQPRRTKQRTKVKTRKFAHLSPPKQHLVSANG